LNQQLTALSDLTTEKQHAMTLLNLKASGYSENDVKELLKHVNNGRKTASDIWVDN